MEDKILKEVDNLSHEMIELCQNLVRVNTVNPYSGDSNPGNETNGQVILRPILNNMGAKTRMFETPEDIYNIMGVIGPKGRNFKDRMNLVGEFNFGGGGKRIIINGHMDTVAVSGMKIEPFSGEIKNGKIWGRGTSDCKGNLATGLMAIKALLPYSHELCGSIVYESVVEEECSGSGAGTLTCCHEGYTGDMAIVVDGGDLDIIYGCGGCLTADLMVYGQGGHAATGGISAIDKGLMIKNAIDDFKQKRESQNSSSKVNLGIFNSGVHSAVVPSRAYLSMNIVYQLKEAYKAQTNGLGFGGAEIRKEFENIIRECEEKDEWLKEHRSDIGWVKDLLPFETPEDTPFIKELSAVYTDVLGKEPQVVKINAWL
ncbi:M20/M25/M40 family metallo-hydrolase, partial [Candidatus Poribacteria bacterium]|nr:M20/M25/M40 family metallo-hydrolase [Candidatus Poribacteria bacterium]